MCFNSSWILLDAFFGGPDRKSCQASVLLRTTCKCFVGNILAMFKSQKGPYSSVLSC